MYLVGRRIMYTVGRIGDPPLADYFLSCNKIAYFSTSHTVSLSENQISIATVNSLYSQHRQIQCYAFHPGAPLILHKTPILPLQGYTPFFSHLARLDQDITVQIKTTGTLIPGP